MNFDSAVPAAVDERSRVSVVYISRTAVLRLTRYSSIPFPISKTIHLSA